MSPVFRGEGDDPVVITTQSPDQLRAELRLGLGLAAGLVLAAVIAFGHAGARPFACSETLKAPNLPRSAAGGPLPCVLGASEVPNLRPPALVSAAADPDRGA